MIRLGINPTPITCPIKCNATNANVTSSHAPKYQVLNINIPMHVLVIGSHIRNAQPDTQVPAYKLAAAMN